MNRKTNIIGVSLSEPHIHEFAVNFPFVWYSVARFITFWWHMQLPIQCVNMPMLFFRTVNWHVDLAHPVSWNVEVHPPPLYKYMYIQPGDLKLHSNYTMNYLFLSCLNAPVKTIWPIYTVLDPVLARDNIIQSCWWARVRNYAELTQMQWESKAYLYVWRRKL